MLFAFAWVFFIPHDASTRHAINAAVPFLYPFPPLWPFPLHVIGRLAFKEARDYHAMRDSLAVVAMMRKGAVADVQHGIVGEHKHSSIVVVPVYFLRRACEAEAALYPSVNCFLSLAPWTPS